MKFRMVTPNLSFEFDYEHADYFFSAILSIRQAVIILSSSWKPSTFYIKWIENIIITCSCNTEERKNKPNLNLFANEFKL